MKLRGTRYEFGNENGWLVMKSINDQHHHLQIRLMNIIDESSPLQQFFRSGQSQPSHGRHPNHVPTLHPLTSSLIPLVIVIILFWMVTVSAACGEEGLSANEGSETLEIDKRSTGHRCGTDDHRSMCERCTKATRSTIVFVQCCSGQSEETERYCSDLLGPDRGRTRRALRLPTVWIRLLKRR